MAVRWAGKEDKEQIKALWQYAFNETESFMEYFFTKRYREEYNLVVAEEEIRASLLLNPYTLHHQRGEETVRYVVGISVWPEYRGMKYTTKLLRESFERLYEQGESLSLLMPIDTGIYRRYGYENCFDMQILELEVEHITAKEQTGYFLRRVRSSEDGTLADARAVYEKNSLHWQNFLLRDKNYFADFFEEVRQENGEILVCYDRTGLAKGYMVFYPKEENEEETGFVRELLVLEAAVYDVFLRLIKSHKTQIKKVIIHQPEDSLLMDFLGNDNQVRRQSRPFLMARILNLRKLLQKLPLSEETDLRIRVSDPMIAANDGLFHLTAKGITEMSPDQKEDFGLSIGEMTRLYMGRLSFDQLCFLKGEDGPQEKRKMMKEIFPKKSSYINDYI